MTTELRSGYSTGACAAAAAKAAAMLLSSDSMPQTVIIDLPKTQVEFPVHSAQRLGKNRAIAGVIKDAGDDPDVTNGAEVIVELEIIAEGGIRFCAGKGVGTVTRPGLSLPPGEPAINPSPRKYIEKAIRQIMSDPVQVTVSVPAGIELARQTYNPRLGIEDGISILGTTGIVRPYSVPAQRAALKLALTVAVANGSTDIILVPGNIGRAAAQRHFDLPDQAIVDVSNEWDYMLKQCRHLQLDALIALGHPGKLAKLAMGYWNTHSSESPSAASFVKELAGSRSSVETVEGVMQELSGRIQREVASRLAEKVCIALREKLENKHRIAVVLTGMKGEVYGEWGDFSCWKRK